MFLRLLGAAVFMQLQAQAAIKTPSALLSHARQVTEEWTLSAEGDPLPRFTISRPQGRSRAPSTWLYFQKRQPRAPWPRPWIPDYNPQVENNSRLMQRLPKERPGPCCDRGRGGSPASSRGGGTLTRRHPGLGP